MKLLSSIIILFAVLSGIQCFAIDFGSPRSNEDLCDDYCAHKLRQPFNGTYDTRNWVCYCKNESGEVVASKRLLHVKHILEYGGIPEPLPKAICNTYCSLDLEYRYDGFYDSEKDMCVCTPPPEDKEREKKGKRRGNKVIMVEANHVRVHLGFQPKGQYDY